MAHEGLEGHLISEPVYADTEALRSAYAACAQITKAYSRTFYLASAWLPAEKRRAVRALYAFCRISDDLIDRNDTDPQASLEDWRRSALHKPPPYHHPVILAWADTRACFHIPRRYAEQLIDGVARDLHQNRYATFEDLSAYCYGVASTVGLMAMHIVGFDSQEAIPYALKLGVALQLTNILRDVGEDWRAGRLYLPLEELAQFGLSEADIAAGNLDGRWQAFLDYQLSRNRELYAQSIPGIALLSPDGRFAIAAAAELYQAILKDIEAHRGDVFARRAHVSGWNKIRRLWFIRRHLWFGRRGLNLMDSNRKIAYDR
jgi:phytoene synthase